MPQNGAPSTIRDAAIQVAQAGGNGGGADASPVDAGVATHASVGHTEAPGGLLTENSPFYYSYVALLVCAIIVTFGFVTTRGLRTRNPSRGQTLIEQCVASMQHFCRAAIGEGGERFAPLIGTIFAFVLVSNLMGSLPLVFKSTEGGQVTSFLPAPTANLSMTIAISLIVFVVVQYVGIKSNGIVGYLKHFAGPVWWLAWLMFPIEIVSALVRPVSLSVRLFGNVFGEETAVAVLIGLMAAIHWPIPIQFPMLVFGVFGAVVQAGVYVILSCAYIALAIGDHDSHGNHVTLDVLDEQIPSTAHAPRVVVHAAH